MFETNVLKVGGKERGSVLQQAEGKSRDGVREPLKSVARAAPSSAHGLFPPSITIAGRTLADLMGLPAQTADPAGGVVAWLLHILKMGSLGGHSLA